MLIDLVIVTPAGMFHIKIMFFDSHDGCMNEAQCYVIRTFLVLCIPDIAWFKSISSRFVILRWFHSNQGRVVWYFYDGLIQIKNVSFCISEMAWFKSRSCSLVFLLQLDSNKEHVGLYLRFMFCVDKGLSTEEVPVYNQKFRNLFFCIGMGYMA
jgi:hypothetical protein